MEQGDTVRVLYADGFVVKGFYSSRRYITKIENVRASRIGRPRKAHTRRSKYYIGTEGLIKANLSTTRLVLIEKALL
jgi:hypothetical protein